MFIKIIKNFGVLLFCLVLASCASTRVKDSWLAEDHAKKYKLPMIIGISDSQQTRRIYEDYLVGKLEINNVRAVASHTLISSKQKMNRETVINTLAGTEIDSVIVTYLVSADVKIVHRDSPLNTGYSSNVENNMVSDTLISNRGRSRSGEVVVLKSDLYDAETYSMVWSMQTKSVAPESIDQVITEVTALIVGRLLDDQLFE